MFLKGAPNYSINSIPDIEHFGHTLAYEQKFYNFSISYIFRAQIQMVSWFAWNMDEWLMDYEFSRAEIM